ncbi:MAG: Crp/Fnr family transcriptional regulator [Rhodobacteraceae bacterium]|nr:Crp/Fnr family transcriptional regulator [Paracoccaceae bacterium]
MQRNELTFPKGSFLGRINLASWEQLSALWTVKQYRSGHFLISADDVGQEVFFIVDGSVKATIYTDGGREVAFLTLSNGDCLGEFSAIDEAPRSSDAIAETDCIIGRISSKQFRDLLKSNSDMSYNLLILLVGHLRRLDKRVIDFNAKSADKRLREKLLELAEMHQKDNEALIEKPPTQAQLAAYVFSSRESVAREMGRMRKAGVLGRRKRALFFPSIKGLRDYLDNQ